MAAQPKIPPQLEIAPPHFIQYETEAMSQLPDADRRWLSGVGMPTEAPPMLVFQGRNPFPEGILPGGYFYLGSTNYGDPIALERAAGRVMLLDHESGMTASPINYSLAAFAECLCIFQEHLTNQDMSGCSESMGHVDPTVLEETNFWQTEIAGRG